MSVMSLYTPTAAIAQLLDTRRMIHSALQLALIRVITTKLQADYY